jgi:streptogramin lyase
MKRVFLAVAAVAALVAPLIAFAPDGQVSAQNPIASFAAVFCEPATTSGQVPAACTAPGGPGQSYNVVLTWSAGAKPVTIWGTSLSCSPSAQQHCLSPETVPVANGGTYGYTLETTGAAGNPFYASTNVVVPDLATPTIAAEPDGDSGNSIEVDPFPVSTQASSTTYLDMKTGQPAQFAWTPGAAPPWLASGTQMVTQVQVTNASGTSSWVTLPQPPAPQQPPYVQPIQSALMQTPSDPFANNVQTLSYPVRSCDLSSDPPMTFCSAQVKVNETLTGAQFQGGFRQFVGVGPNATLNWASPQGQDTPGNFWEVASTAFGNNTPVVTTSKSYAVPTTAAGLEDFYLLSCDLISSTQATCGGTAAPASVSVNAPKNQQVGTVAWSVPTPTTLVSAGEQVGTITLSGSLTCPGSSPPSNQCAVTAPANGIMVSLVANGATVNESASSATKTQDLLNVATTEQEVVVGSTATMTPATFTSEPWTTAFNTQSSKAISVADDPGVGLPTKTVTDPNGNVWFDGEFDTSIGEVNPNTGTATSDQIPVANVNSAPTPPQSTPFYSPLYAGFPTTASALGEGMIYADGRVWAIQGGNLEGPGHSNHSRIVSFDPSGGNPDPSQGIPGDYSSSFCAYSVPGNDNSIYDLATDGKYIWFTDPGSGVDTANGGAFGSIDWFDPTKLSCDSMLDYSKLQSDQNGPFDVVGSHQYCQSSSTTTTSTPNESACVGETGSCPVTSTTTTTTPDQTNCVNQQLSFRAPTIAHCKSGDSAPLKLVADPDGNQIWYNGFGGALGEISYNSSGVTSTQQSDCGSSPPYPTPNTGDGNANDWNMVADSTNVYWSEFSQSELIKFNKSTQTFDAIPLPLASSSDAVASIGIVGDKLYFVVQDGWGSGSELGYVSISSWNSGHPTGMLFTGLASGPNALVAPNNAQIGVNAFDGLSFNSTTGAVAISDYFRRQILVLQPNPSTYIAAPTNGATVSGNVGMDAVATDNAGVTKVQFELTGR